MMRSFLEKILLILINLYSYIAPYCLPKLVKSKNYPFFCKNIYFLLKEVCLYKLIQNIDIETNS